MLNLNTWLLTVILEIMLHSHVGCDYAVSGSISNALNKLRQFKPVLCAKETGQNVKGGQMKSVQEVV